MLTKTINILVLLIALPTLSSLLYAQETMPNREEAFCEPTDLEVELAQLKTHFQRIIETKEISEFATSQNKILNLLFEPLTKCNRTSIRYNQALTFYQSALHYINEEFEFIYYTLTQEEIQLQKQEHSMKGPSPAQRAALQALAKLHRKQTQDIASLGMAIHNRYEALGLGGGLETAKLNQLAYMEIGGTLGASFSLLPSLLEMLNRFSLKAPPTRGVALFFKILRTLSLIAPAAGVCIGKNIENPEHYYEKNSLPPPPSFYLKFGIKEDKQFDQNVFTLSKELTKDIISFSSFSLGVAGVRALKNFKIITNILKAIKISGQAACSGAGSLGVTIVGAAVGWAFLEITSAIVESLYMENQKQSFLENYKKAVNEFISLPSENARKMAATQDLMSASFNLIDFLNYEIQEMKDQLNAELTSLFKKFGYDDKNGNFAEWHVHQFENNFQYRKNFILLTAQAVKKIKGILSHNRLHYDPDYERYFLRKHILKHGLTQSQELLKQMDSFSVNNFLAQEQRIFNSWTKTAPFSEKRSFESYLDQSLKAQIKRLLIEIKHKKSPPVLHPTRLPLLALLLIQEEAGPLSFLGDALLNKMNTNLSSIYYISKE